MAKGLGLGKDWLWIGAGIAVLYFGVKTTNALQPSIQDWGKFSSSIAQTADTGLHPERWFNNWFGITSGWQ